MDVDVNYEVEVYARPTRNGNFICQHKDRFFYLSANHAFLGHTYVGEWNWAAMTWNRKAVNRNVRLPSQLQFQ